MEDKRRRKKKRKKNKAKLISILVAIALILIIGGIVFGTKIKKAIADGEEINWRWFLGLIYPDKYAYSKEIADYNEYYQLFSDDEIAIVLQDEIIEDKAKLINGTPYFSYDTVKKLFTKRFYYNDSEKQLLYTNSKNVIEVNLSDDKKGYMTRGISGSGNFTDTDYACAVLDGDTLYIAADYVKLYSNFSYALYNEPNRMQVYTSWKPVREATLKKKTKVRVKGGIKSEILTDVAADEKVTIIEIMESWTKIKTADGFIGYVENNKLNDEYEATYEPVKDAYNPRADYSQGNSSESIVAVWHQIFFKDDGSNLNELVAATNATGIDVVMPTWYALDSTDGTFKDYSNPAYVENAHAKGYKVWALIEDMTYSSDVDEYKLFSSSSKRTALINNLVNAVKSTGADGINIDFEKIGKETGPHYVQFLRELSIEAHKNGLILSIDDYQQNEGNKYYNLGEQGLVADYVIIMGYDEHWGGCPEAGSVASINFVENGIKKAIEAGVPAAKLINGVPFYTRLWTTEGVNVTSEALNMTIANEWCTKHNLTPGWDETTAQYYATRSDGTAVYEMWLENADSINSKLAVMKNYNVVGVACWRLGFETNDIWSVINSYY